MIVDQYGFRSNHSVTQLVTSRKRIMRSKSAPAYHPNIKSDLLIWYNHSNVASLMSSHLWPNLGELLAVIALLTLWPTASEPQGSTSSKQYHSCGTCCRAFLWYWLSLWNLQGLGCAWHYMFVQKHAFNRQLPPRRVLGLIHFACRPVATCATCVSCTRRHSGPMGPFGTSGGADISRGIAVEHT